MITFEQIKSFNPCYCDERLWELFPATLKEVLTRTDGSWENVSHNDRVWVAVRILPLDIVKRFALDCAKRVSKDKNIIQNIEDYLDGKPVDIKAVAKKANDAAYAANAAYCVAAADDAVAAAYAAYTAADAAADAAAADAAAAAGYAVVAASAAANAAAAYAASAAANSEQQNQINFLLRYV